MSGESIKCGVVNLAKYTVLATFDSLVRVLVAS